MKLDMFGAKLNNGDTILVNKQNSVFVAKVWKIGTLVAYVDSLDIYTGHNYCKPDECIKWTNI